MSARHRNHYGPSPAKGTKARVIMLAMLRDGITDRQAVALGVAHGYLSSMIERFVDQLGWDVRGVPIPNPHYGVTRSQPRHVLSYRIVGRCRWDGTYRSLIDPKKLTIDIRPVMGYTTVNETRGDRHDRQSRHPD
jgi:hypothetical protein